MRETKYLIVADRLKRRLEEEGYHRGDKLPTEAELGEYYQVSRRTIRRALMLLKQKNLITSRKGSGYHYQLASRGHRDPSGYRIALVSTFRMIYFYEHIIAGIEQVLSSSGSILERVELSVSDAAAFEDAITRLQDYDGVILEPTYNLQGPLGRNLVDALQSAHVPLVYTHWKPFGGNAPLVAVDDYHAGYQAALYLAQMGHQSVGCVAKSDSKPGLDRLEGFRSGCLQAGINLSASQIALVDANRAYSMEEIAQRATSRLIELMQRPSAIFFYNDSYAIEGMKTIRQAGLKVPEDISVIGVDDIPEASLTTPSLTTFIHPKFEMGRQCAITLLGLLAHPNPSVPMRILFEPTLLERSSVLRRSE